jgi:hypothetical protein
MLKSPVLLITFNRPDTTEQVFNAIRKAKPSRLYIFNDGPRKGNVKDKVARDNISQIVDNVDWECSVKKNFPDSNKGCGPGVSGAISWAFENEDRLIILEDDCVPTATFFSYCDHLLEKYKDDTRISMISGNNYTERNNYTDTSYFFSKYGHIWGWATWKRAWEKYDYHMLDWPEFNKTLQLQNIFRKPGEINFMRRYFERVYNQKEKGTWDHQWFFCRIKENGLSIIPSHNLVTNVGFVGTHSENRSNAHLIPVKEDYTITKEPKFVLCNMKYDAYHFKKIINRKRSLHRRILRKLSSTFNLK